jgi:shikimate kinase
MGVGKSTVGRIAAGLMGFEFRDLDEQIEAKAGMTIPAVFERQGESAFRALETRCLRESAEWRSTVISVGGGAPCQPENPPLLRALGCVILLVATPATILARVQPIETRPMLVGAPDPLRRIEELLTARRSAYEMADVTVATDDRTPVACASEVCELFRSWLEGRT